MKCKYFKLGTYRISYECKLRMPNLKFDLSVIFPEDFEWEIKKKRKCEQTLKGFFLLWIICSNRRNVEIITFLFYLEPKIEAMIHVKCGVICVQLNCYCNWVTLIAAVEWPTDSERGRIHILFIKSELLFKRIYLPFVVTPSAKTK